MFNGAVKFIKLTKYNGDGRQVLVNLNDIIFVNDELTYREVQVKLPDRVLTLKVDEELDTIHGMIEIFKSKQPIYD